MNIHEFLQATTDGLARWYLVHYDRNTWVDSWVGANDIEKYFETCGGILSNPFFRFDWKTAALQRMVSDAMTSLQPRHLWDSLYEEGFDAFCAGTHRRTDPIKDEVLDNLRAISDVGNSEDQLYLALWSLKITHSTGYIADDYSTASSNQVDMVRRLGPGVVFGVRDVEKFMRGEYPRLTVCEEMLNLMGLRGANAQEEMGTGPQDPERSGGDA